MTCTCTIIQNMCRPEICFPIQERILGALKAQQQVTWKGGQRPASETKGGEQVRNYGNLHVLSLGKFELFFC